MNPVTVSTYSSIEELAREALKIFGESAVSTMDAETMSMFLVFANEVVDDYMASPYLPDGKVVPLYLHFSESREINDQIMRAGLLYKLAAQQGSGKASMREAMYFRALNTVMSREFNGNGNTKFEMQVVKR